MKSSSFAKLVPIAAAISLGSPRGVSAQAKYCQSSRGDAGGGYHYEMWVQDGTPGTACMVLGGAEARFKVDWDLTGYGFVARVGLLFDQTRTDEQIGWLASDFALAKSGTGSAWMGIYGWMVDPLTEYYIIDDWLGSPPQYKLMGTFTADGGEYNVYFNTRVQQPSIQGTKTFDQWYSVRKTPRSEGHISISEHFAEWRALGMVTGKLYEAKLKVEGLGGKGSVEFTRAAVTAGPEPASLRPGAYARGPVRGNLRVTRFRPSILANGALAGSAPGAVPFRLPEPHFSPAPAPVP